MSNTISTISTEEVINAITATVADSIEGFNVYTCDDGGGAYISLNTVGNDEDYRCISLADVYGGGCPEELDKYRWNFWNNETNAYVVADFGASASIDEVLDFLNECLEADAKNY